MIISNHLDDDRPGKLGGPSREMVAKALHTAAQTRWLTVTEIQLLLSSQQKVLPLSHNAPKFAPESGSLFLYDRNLTRNYKSDHHYWVRKRNSNKIREDHVKLKVNGVNKIAGCYVHSSHIPTMHRRAYHLLLRGDLPSTPTFTNRASSLVLVHYLDTDYASMLLNQTPTPSLCSSSESERPQEVKQSALRMIQDLGTGSSMALRYYERSDAQLSPKMSGNQAVESLPTLESSGVDLGRWKNDIEQIGHRSKMSSLGISAQNIFMEPAVRNVPLAYSGSMVSNNNKMMGSPRRAINKGNSLGDLWDSIMGDEANHLDQELSWEATEGGANQQQVERQEARSLGHPSRESRRSLNTFLVDLQSPNSWD